MLDHVERNYICNSLMIGYILVGSSHDEERVRALAHSRLRNSILPNSLHTYLLHFLDPADTSYPRDTDTRTPHLAHLPSHPSTTMKRLPSSESSPIRLCDKKLKRNHGWTSKYGPDDYDYSLENPLSPVDPIYCPTSPQYRPSSPPYRLVSPAYCPASPTCPPASPGYAPTSPAHPVSPTFFSVSRFGYNGRFHTPCPDHVVLESSDECKFYISRALLAQAR